MDNVKNNVKQYFFDACKKYKYGFVTNYKEIDGIKENFEENYSVYTLEEIPTRVNTFWHECDLSVAVDKIFSYSKEDMKSHARLYNLPADFFEKVWLSCQSKEEKKVLWEICNHYLIKDIIEYLPTLTSNEYLNEFIQAYYSNESNHSRHTPRQELFQLIDLFKNKNFKLTDKSFQLICNANKYTIKELTAQKALKEFVEQYMPESIEVFKKYWKKIDIDLVQDDFLTEGMAPYFAFNKIELYNLVSNKNTEFFDKRLKSLTAFLNKSEIQQLIGINRCILDGTQDGQQHYRFFFIKDEKAKNFKLKEIINELVIGVINIENDPSIKSFKTLINYAILKQSALGNDTNNTTNKRPKL